MLSVTGMFKYMTDTSETFSATEIPVGKNVLLVLLQPINGNDLDKVEAKLPLQSSAWLENLSPRYVFGHHMTSCKNEWVRLCSAALPTSCSPARVGSCHWERNIQCKQRCIETQGCHTISRKNFHYVAIGWIYTAWKLLHQRCDDRRTGTIERCYKGREEDSYLYQKTLGSLGKASPGRISSWTAQWQSALKWDLREVQPGSTPSGHTAELPSPVLPGLTGSFPQVLSQWFGPWLSSYHTH